ncbi:MAG TPA: helix-turn-helix transcriptional regulator [Clostridiales bacterium]|nr:helix-turn-helix transcriptional regulator [Clostridiales bacterium]
MKEIHIARVLAGKRKEKGITQEELANYIGVSKASVSKWETGQSYPDVTFLPQLAAYFNISVDELIDYQPQMAKEDIQKLYLRLSADFCQKPFETVLAECRRIIKKYYACFPLLLQMGILLVNHLELVKDREKATSLLKETKELFRRVKEGSNEVETAKKALYMEAFCALAENDADTVLYLLEDAMEPALPPEALIAPAYQMKGQNKEAKTVLQSGIYQNLVVLFNFFPAYLLLCVDDKAKFRETLSRAENVAATFRLQQLHPGVLAPFYLNAAHGYLMQQNNDGALEMLKKYTETVTGDIYPLCLHGDDFFDLIENWLAQLDIGNALPRDEKTIRKSMANAVTENPAFAALKDDPHFLKIIAKLRNSLQQEV